MSDSEFAPDSAFGLVPTTIEFKFDDGTTKEYKYMKIKLDDQNSVGFAKIKVKEKWADLKSGKTAPTCIQQMTLKRATNKDNLSPVLKLGATKLKQVLVTLANEAVQPIPYKDTAVQTAFKDALTYAGYNSKDVINVYLGEMKTQPHYNKPTGIQSTAKNYRVRADYDPDKGLHFNVEPVDNKVTKPKPIAKKAFVIQYKDLEKEDRFSEIATECEDNFKKIYGDLYEKIKTDTSPQSAAIVMKYLEEFKI
ncbi:hypothetical protein L218DRAFT_1035919 [Marasmius fiardii PR-910]|nr:hypothetical protein L218DRAFT_1035919 [Marasmius fiardii PR-910]